MNPFALIGSLLVHGAVAIWVFTSLPNFGDRLELGRVVNVELVELAPAADAPTEAPAEAAPLPERQATRRPDPTPPETEPSPEPPGVTTREVEPEQDVAALPAPALAPAAEPEPSAPPPDVIPEPEPTPEPEAEPAPPPDPSPTRPAEVEPADDAPRLAAVPRRRPQIAAAASRPEPEGQPQPNPDALQEETTEPDPLDALLQSVEQLTRRLEADTERAGTGSEADQGVSAIADLRSQQLQRSIYDQIIGCWSVPAGLDGVADVGTVEIRAEFSPGGAVLTTAVLDADRLRTDRVFRSVAESAQRAIYNCTPLRGLPGDLYDQWRVMIVEFDPGRLSAGG